MIGLRFGRLIVTGFSHTKDRHTYYSCTCDCGGTKVILGDHLRANKTVSCGCLLKEILQERNRKTKENGHQMYGTPTYAVWRIMRHRCASPQKTYYQGRGIKVCSRWNKFENFLKDMGLRPSLDHTIDRINNNGHYTPDNCRWATKKEQTEPGRRRVCSCPKCTYHMKMYKLLPDPD